MSEFVSCVARHNLYDIEEYLDMALEYYRDKYGELLNYLPDVFLKNPLIKSISNDQLSEGINILNLDNNDEKIYWLVILYYNLPLPPFWDIKYNNDSCYFTYKNLITTKLHPSIIYIDKHIEKYKVNPEYFDIIDKEKIEDINTNNKYDISLKKVEKIENIDLNLFDIETVKKNYQDYILLKKSNPNKFKNLNISHSYFINKQINYNKNKLYYDENIPKEKYITNNTTYNPLFFNYIPSDNIDELEVYNYYIKNRNEEIKDKREQIEFEKIMEEYSTSKAKLNENISKKILFKYDKIYDYKVRTYENSKVNRPISSINKKRIESAKTRPFSSLLSTYKRITSSDINNENTNLIKIKNNDDFEEEGYLKIEELFKKRRR